MATGNPAQEPAAELEGHLRNLILTNTTDSSPAEGQSSKAAAGRKRLNQAQRRQLSSQLSIPVDTRPQPAASHPPARPHFGHHGHASSQPHGQWNTRPQPHHQHHQHQQQMLPPDSSSPHFARGGNRTLYDHRRQQPRPRPQEIDAQASLLDKLCWHVVANSEIDRSEIADKEALRQRIETISRDVIARYEEEQASRQGFPAQSVELKCFGSLSSGFATKASDMDLGILSPLSLVQPDVPGSPIPRLLEKALLDAGLGARLLDRTRVPIIKLCEKPPDKLRRDLLAKRHAWERGLDEDAEDPDDENTGFAHGHATEDLSRQNGPTSPSTTQFEIPWGDDGGTQHFYLKQGPKLSLSSYYGLAKRVLRKAGGRDVTMLNQGELNDREWIVLNRVCQAFVDGLTDPDLRSRLAQYPFLSPNYRDNFPRGWSLVGVFAQVEGEHMLQAWETWSFRDAFQSGQANVDQAATAWYGVQPTPSSGRDPVAYATELQLSLEKLRRVPVIQLVSLEQALHETPRQYHARAKSIVSLFYSAQHGLSDGFQPGFVDRYISGIHHFETRDAVKASMDTSSELPDLELAACLHRSFHLSRELERALEKPLYDATQLDDIRSYIQILQSPLPRMTKLGGSHTFVVSILPHHQALLRRIRELHDPHGIVRSSQPRDRYRDPLEFPKTGAGVQCDINFSAHLALQNTLLLRCYSHTDSRVRPMVLFIKHWAKTRGINSGYRGTLSSYGFVLMVLHYLVNVARPFVCPNLQQLAPLPPSNLSPAELEDTVLCRGYNVQFWRDEQEIMQFARANQLNHNAESVGHLLRGFFEYFAQNGLMSNGSARGFDWGRDVLSLRTQGGLLSKQDKGWTGAKTVFESQGAGPTPTSHAGETTAAQQQAATSNEPGPQSKHAKVTGKDPEVKEVRHRYLFAIEDPFEVEHNVARTVTHNGIVSIRDEFRRAWRIIRSAGLGNSQEDLLADADTVDEGQKPFQQLLSDIHGRLAL